MTTLFVPMAGAGDRYRRAGHTRPKPLIDVAGRPMIARVLDAYPGVERVVFAINREHAETTDLASVLSDLRPNSRIVVCEPHKDGPVRTLLDAADALPDDDDLLVSYCDFGVEWDFPAFSTFIRNRNGAMSAYRGFHPHSLGPTLYAYMRTDGNRVVEIREKHHFTRDKLAEWASTGLYWFDSGARAKALARALIARGERVQGEFYVSMLMQMLIEQGGDVGVFPVERFFQWGTAEDLDDWASWASSLSRLDEFRRELASVRSCATQLLPMAGLGTRFAAVGYADPKPLIPVAGRPMFAASLDTLPKPIARTVVLRKELAKDERVGAALGAAAPPVTIVALDTPTEGQACTVARGLFPDDDDRPVMVTPCDTAYVYDIDRLLAAERAVAKGSAPLVVFAARGHLPAIWRPKMYGWMRSDDGQRVQAVAVKEPVPNLPSSEQWVVTGTFLFGSGRKLRGAIDALVADDQRVNGEFYVDTIVRRMVESGEDVRIFPVTKYLPFGTPEELRTFEYWNAVFRGGGTW